MSTVERPSPLARIVRGSGPGLVLAHGGGGGAELNWGPIIDPFAARFTIVAPDYPGAGGTPVQETPLELDALADQVVGAALDSGLERFGLVGYSLGSCVAIRAVSRHPDRIAALVAGFAHPDARLSLAIDVWSALLDGDPDLLGRFLVMAGFSPSFLARQSPQQLDELVRVVAATVPPGTAAHVSLARGLDLRGELAQIAAPTLVVATTRDDLATPEHSQLLHASIPGARLVELESGHAVVAERGDELVSAISEFAATCGAW